MRLRLTGSQKLALLFLALAITSVLTTWMTGMRTSDPEGIAAENQLPLIKRTAFPCCTIGTIKTIALGNFDSDSANELAVLGAEGIAFVSFPSGATKVQRQFSYTGCDSCYHLHESVIGDGSGSFLVATSAGVFDKDGKTIWTTKSGSSRRTVPLVRSNGELVFITHSDSNVALRDRNGITFWQRPLTADDVGHFVNTSGDSLLFATATIAGMREMKFFGMAGEERQSLRLPFWAMWAQPVSFPRQSNFLVGSGSELGVIDRNEKELLRHSISGTSFLPEGAPKGTAVRLAPDAPAYLAVVVDGGADRPRSVLLIFDQTGTRVWQGEMNRIYKLLAVPRSDGRGEVLLVAGWDGVLEFAL